MIRIFKFIVISCILIVSAHASVGLVESYKGVSYILRHQKKILVKHGLQLEEKDIIKTTKNAWIRLRLNDNTIINAGKSATLVIQEYLYTTKSNSKASFSFVKGLFRTITGQIGKVAPQKFKVHTPNATIGIRGTEFYVDLSKSLEKIFCTRGRIIIDSILGEVEVDAGNVLQLNGKKYSIKKIHLNSIKKRIGIGIQKATIKEKALIQRSTDGVLFNQENTDSSVESIRYTNVDQEGENTEQENAALIDNIVPEIPHPEPCPVPR